MAGVRKRISRGGRHCEERSEEAIQSRGARPLDRFAPLAMTGYSIYKLIDEANHEPAQRRRLLARRLRMSRFSGEVGRRTRRAAA